MGAVLLGAGRNTIISAGNYVQIYGKSGQFSPETSGQQLSRISGTFSNLGCSFHNEDTAPNIQFRKNAANGNLVVNGPNSADGIVYDNAHTDHVTAGTDNFDYHLGLGTTNWTTFFNKIVFTADSGHAGIYGNGGIQTNGGNDPEYWPLMASISLSTVESRLQAEMRAAGTIKNLSVQVTTAFAAIAPVFTVRKNGANGNSTVTCTANTTGLFEDTTNTDAFVSGDLINLALTGTGASTGFQAAPWCHVAWSTTTNDVTYAFDGGNTSSASDQFFPLVGWNNASGGITEAQANMQHGFAVTTTNFRANCYFNTGTSTAQTITIRKNGADGNQTASLAAGATGWIEDTTNTDSFTATDTVDWVIRGGSVGTAFYASVILTESPTATAVNPPWGRWNQFMSWTYDDTLPMQ